MHSVVRASNIWLDQISYKIDKVACAGGMDVLLGSLKPAIDVSQDEPMTTELVARCTERR